MIPPTSGKQAIAAATLEGSPVEVGRALASSSLRGGGGAGATGSIGLAGSGILLFTKARGAEQVLPDRRISLTEKGVRMIRCESSKI